MGQVNVHAQLTATGVDLPAGDTQYWVTSGVGYGMGVSYYAWPLAGPPWDKNVEVTDVSYDVDAAGNHLVDVAVHNKSATDYASYGLCIVWTDAP